MHHQKSNHSYALVNLKPIVPGHVLVVPLRNNVMSLSDLTVEESTDYFKTVQLIQRFVRWQFKSNAENIAIQDGPEAGQSVPHLHTHIIPRYRKNNFGDLVYEMIDRVDLAKDWETRRQEYLNNNGREGRKDEEKEFRPDGQRVERASDAMAEETRYLTAQLKEYLKQFPEIAEQWAFVK